MRTRASLTALAYLALSCSSIDEALPSARAQVPAVSHDASSGREHLVNPSARIVIVAIDGARWQEIFGGTDPVLARASGLGASEAASADELVPNIRALARRGVTLGAGPETSFEASGPNFVSLPGYTEILTGRPAPCQENACEARPRFTLADEIRALPSVGRRDVAVISSWERIDAIAAGDPTNVVVSAGRSHGETRELLANNPATAALLHSASRSEPYPGHDDYRPDRDTAAIATSYFEEQRPRFMFVSLGDSDEYAHAGDYRAYLGALRRADALVGDLARIARSWSVEGEEVAFFVTADHGRSADFRAHGRDYPESARTWLVAAGGPLARPGLVAPRGARGRLRDIAPTVREIMGLSPDTDRASGNVLTNLFSTEGPRVALRD